MITRREVNTALGATLAALISGTAAALRVEAAPPQSNSQEHPPSNPPRGVASLMTESIPDLGDCDATMLILTLQPKHVSSPHKHSGPVFAYVLEGHVENQVDPEEPKKYSAGDSWYEPAMHVHRMFTNLSDTELAKVLVFMLTPKGKPAGLPAQ
jgi:quercetin dioxygenase-like cupin family protein